MQIRIGRRQLVAGLAAVAAIPQAKAARPPAVYIAWKGVGNDQGIYYTSSSRIPDIGAPAKINPVGTATRPALVTLPGKMLMAWRGINGDDGLYFSTFDGNAWENQTPIGGSGSAFGPSLALWNGGAFMAWNGVGNDTRIWSSTYAAAAGRWAPQRPTGIKSGSGPAVTAIHGKLLMVWRGEGDNDNLYSATSTNGVSWTAPQQIADAASTDAPALAFIGGQAYLAFKGGRGDTGIYMSRFIDGVGNGSWVYRWKVPNIGTAVGPGLGFYGNAIFMTWPGVPGDDALYWAQSHDGTAGSWSGQAKIPGGGSSNTPAVAYF